MRPVIYCVTIDGIPDQVFETRRLAVAHVREEIEAFWEAAALFDPSIGRMPRDLSWAQSMLDHLHTDGSWEFYEIVPYQIIKPWRRIGPPEQEKADVFEGDLEPGDDCLEELG